MGIHSMVIVDYWKIDSNNYWFIQYLWGKNFWDNEFTKIEFGQDGIEGVGIFEPNIKSKKKFLFNKEDKDTCNLGNEILSPVDNWKNNVEKQFEKQNSKNKKLFNHFYGVNKLLTKSNTIKCYYSDECIDLYKGIYK